MKKSILLILSLAASFSLAAMDTVTLDMDRVHLGYLDGEMLMPKELMVERTMETPNKVVLTFSYTQEEMICEDRVPDNGGGHHSLVSTNKSVRHWRYGYRNWGWYHGNHNYNNNYYHRGADRNYLGVCRKWTTMGTEKSGRVGLIFRKDMEANSEMIKVKITRRDRHSTSVYFNARMIDPSTDYVKRRKNSRVIIFE